MEKTKQHIGNRIKEQRLQQKKTIEEIAQTCGFSKSHLSKIENNKVFPSIGTLIKIAKSLNANISSFIEEKDAVNLSYITKDLAENRSIQTGKGFLIFPYSSYQKDNKIQIFLYSAKKDRIKPHSDSHEGKEFIFVIEGSLRLRVVDTDYLLNPGDSLYFDSNNEHECKPETEETKYLDIFI